MENKNNNKEESKTSGVLLICFLLVISWGIPSLIEGNGFVSGIVDNIKALLFLITIVIVGYVIFKLFLEK